MTRAIPDPCVALTIYDDLRGVRALPMVDRLARAAAPGDLAGCVHDPPSGDDAGLAAAVKARGLRLWYAWGVDPDTRRSPDDAERIAAERAALAVSRGAELVELNGEAAFRTSDAAERERLGVIASRLIAGVRRAGVPVSWTSFDHLRYHALPWRVIYGAGGVDVAAPQKYAAPEEGTAGFLAARARLKSADAQWAPFVSTGVVRPDLAPGQPAHHVYGQAHHLTVAGAATVFDSADTARVWALPTRCDDAGLAAVEAVLVARRATGRRAGALRRLQAAHGLAVDGNAGTATMTVVRALLGR